jgi:protein gp37
VYLTKTWGAPYKMQAQLKQTPGIYKRMFTCSLSDFFHPMVDGRKFDFDAATLKQLTVSQRVSDISTMTWRDYAWQVIRDTPQVVYLILTKRPELIAKRLPADWGEGYPNVWLGVSVGCNLSLPKMDVLRKIPIHTQAVRFVSHEPVVEDISRNVNYDGIGWVIAGGESGTNPEYLYNPTDDWRKMIGQPGRRTMKIEWAYALMLRAKQAGIPFMFKQITSGRSGVGKDALGFIIQEFPVAPFGGTWAPGRTE